MSDTFVMTLVRPVSALLLLFLFGGDAAVAWGPTGHAIVGQIAWLNLNENARRQVAALLAPGETLASVSSWADEVRPQRAETGPWHYINTPLDARRGDILVHCPAGGCVIKIIPEMIARLKASSTGAVERAEALKFLVHFVGDMHQPLHVGDNRDRGGNDVRVVFLSRPSNLHSIWDTSIVERMLQDNPGWRRQVERRHGFWTRKANTEGGLENWAWEGHALSRDVAYRHLPPARPADLGMSYQRAAAPVVQRQLLRGGLRLAKVLNEIWPD